MERDFEVIDTVLTGLTAERESLLQERRELLRQWKQHAAVELELLRDVRAVQLPLTAETSRRRKPE